MNVSQDKNSMVWLLAGFGLGAIVGAAAGILFAPKEGTELRGELKDKVKELKGKSQEWVSEQKSKGQDWVNEQRSKAKSVVAAAEDAVDEVGA